MTNKAVRLICTALIAIVLSGLLISCKERTKQAPTLDPMREKAQDYYLQGRRLFLSNNPSNFPAAVEKFEQALQFWEDYPEANAAIAETLSMAKGFRMTDDEFALAYTYAQRAIRLDPESSMGYRALADLLRHKNENQLALQQIDRAIQQNPNSAENYYVKGSILLASDAAAAKQQFEKALSLDSHLPKTYFNLAVANQQLKDLDSAEKLIKQYQTLVEQDLGGYCSLGVIYRQAGKVEEALNQFEQVFAKQTIVDQNLMSLQSHWVFLANLVSGEIYANELIDPEKGIPYLERALALSPFSTEAISELILAHDNLGHNEKAEEYRVRLKQAKAEIDNYKDEASVLEQGIPEEMVTPPAPMQQPPQGAEQQEPENQP